MSNWTAGYVADIGYTFGYFRELNPLRVRLAFLNAGIAYPEIKTACELGYGQGVSSNMHAAASAVTWYGTDFNPSQAAFAREMAQVSGAAANLDDQSFADFCSRDDLPDFDYIGLHGIWSWISSENQAVIVDFIRRKLKVGGVLYVSYNAQPGWAAMVPMRHLLARYAAVMAAPGGGIVSRIDMALEFTAKLMAGNPRYARANPQMIERMKILMAQDRHYLAHEYFNRDWQPLHFAEMAEWLSPAKVSYASSANLLDDIASINLSEGEQALLRDIPDGMFRESVRDFIVNQQFRRDYWVKGIRPLSSFEQTENLKKLRLVLATPRNIVPLKANGALGEMPLAEKTFAPILDVLSDHRPKTIGQIARSLNKPDIPLPQLLESVLILAGNGNITIAQDEDIVGKAKVHTDRLNRYLIDRARGSDEIPYLVSPVCGGGLEVGRFQQLFLAALTEGRKSPAEWAAYVWQIIAAQGQVILKDGQPLRDAKANLAELERQARDFADNHLPVFKALGVR